MNFVFIPPDLIPRRQIPAHRPVAIDRFLEVLDNPASFPVLVHCRAGLNRNRRDCRCLSDGTRRLVTPLQAWDELRANGFGEFTSTDDNDYITQYVLSYHPGLRSQTAMKAPVP